MIKVACALCGELYFMNDGHECSIKRVTKPHANVTKPTPDVTKPPVTKPIDVTKPSSDVTKPKVDVTKLNGRPVVGEAAMTGAERKRRQRARQ